jgi:hypothetical protein
MRTRLATAIGAALLLAAGASIASAAEVSRVTVPFPFEVNGQMLPAGRYEIRSDEANPTVVFIDGFDHAKNHAVVETMTDNAMSRGKSPSVTFKRHGDVYQLSIVDDGDVVRDVATR